MDNIINGCGLFKAKKTMDKEWVKGGLIPFNPSSGSVFITESYQGHVDVKKTDVASLVLLNTHLVDINTICQFTGKHDKKGVEIWTNDVVRGLFCFGMAIDSVITFKYGAFGLEWVYNGKTVFNAFTSICNVQFEVIGNVIDSPDLLKNIL